MRADAPPLSSFQKGPSHYVSQVTPPPGSPASSQRRGAGQRGGLLSLECCAGVALLLAVVLLGTAVIVLAAVRGGGGSCECSCPAVTVSSAPAVTSDGADAPPGGFLSAAVDRDAEVRALWALYTADRAASPPPEDTDHSLAALDAALAPDFIENCDWSPAFCPLNRSTVLQFHNASNRPNQTELDDTGVSAPQYSEQTLTNSSSGMLCASWTFMFQGYTFQGCDVMTADTDSGTIQHVDSFFNTPGVTRDTIAAFTEAVDACLTEKANSGVSPELAWPCTDPALRVTLEGVMTEGWTGHLLNGKVVGRDAYIDTLETGSLRDTGELWLSSGETFARSSTRYLEQGDSALVAYHVTVNVSSSCDAATGACSETREHHGVNLHRLGLPLDARPWPLGNDTRIADTWFYHTVSTD